MLSPIISKAKDYYAYARVKANAHYDLSNKGQNNSLRLGICCTVLSSIVGTTIFATISKQPSTTSESIDWVRIITGLLSVTAAVFSALQTFLGFSENAEKHRKAGLAYEMACNKIDYFILLYAVRSDDNDKVTFTNALGGLNEILSLIQKAAENAPTIPNWLYNIHKKRFQGSVSNSNAASPESVVMNYSNPDWGGNQVAMPTPATIDPNIAEITEHV